MTPSTPLSAGRLILFVGLLASALLNAEARAQSSRPTSNAERQARLRQLEANGPNSAIAHVELARSARELGLERAMWQHLDKALAKPTDDEATTRRLRNLMARLGPELLPRNAQQAPTDERVRAILRQFRSNTRGSKAAALEELLVREPAAENELRRHLTGNPNQHQRIAVLRALQRRDADNNRHLALRTAVIDRSKSVRQAAIEMRRPTVNAADVAYLAQALGHTDATMRVRTAEALAGLGHQNAIAALVRAAPHAATGLAAGDGGTTTRGHFAFFRQVSYVRDFDVEIASAAFIADPKVDALHSGAVLDATVAGVTQVRFIRRAYRRALHRLAGSDPGANPQAWARWAAQLPKAGEAAQTGSR